MTDTAIETRRAGRSLMHGLVRQAPFVALLLLIAFGAWRYDNFLSSFNISTTLRYNSMFALTALGMTFVIMTGGIDLSVGGVAALASVVGALLSPYGAAVGMMGGLAAGLAIGALNGVFVAYMRIMPFIATLATMLAAQGLALVLSGNQTVAMSWDSTFSEIGQGDLWFVPIPVVIAVVAYAAGSILLNFSSFGRHTLAIGGGEESARMMGLPVEWVLLRVYLLSGGLAGIAGVILASQFGSGLPLEGAGWELSSIAAVVVGGTLLTGGIGSVGATLSGVLLLGLIFSILNFENGKGLIVLNAYWQTVIRGLFLLAVVTLQAHLSRRHRG
jgi:ribose transport system permease protein